MDNLFGAMSPQMLRILFASEDAQKQGYEMILGMMKETGVIAVIVDTETISIETPQVIAYAQEIGGWPLTPDDYARSVLRSLLTQFDLPILMGTENPA